MGRTIDAGVAESGLSPEDELEDDGVKNGLDEADDDDDAEGNNGGGAPIAGAEGAIGGAGGGVRVAASSPVYGL